MVTRLSRIQRKRKQSAMSSLKMFASALRGYGLSMDELLEFAHTKNAPKVAKERTILDIAGELVNGERNKTYRHPNENFRNIKNLWNSYFIAIAERDPVNHVNNIQEFDVAMLMVLMKVARLATNNTHADSLIDIAGYARCAERVLTNK